MAYYAIPQKMHYRNSSINKPTSNPFPKTYVKWIKCDLWFLLLVNYLPIFFWLVVCQYKSFRPVIQKYTVSERESNIVGLCLVLPVRIVRLLTWWGRLGAAARAMVANTLRISSNRYTNGLPMHMTYRWGLQ